MESAFRRGQILFIRAVRRLLEAGFAWIWNTLCGPGLIPEPDEEWYESAQLYWNANNSDPYGPCGICGKPSNTAAHYGVSCCEEHNKQLCDKACREDSVKINIKRLVRLKGVSYELISV